LWLKLWKEVPEKLQLPVPSGHPVKEEVGTINITVLEPQFAGEFPACDAPGGPHIEGLWKLHTEPKIDHGHMDGIRQSSSMPKTTVILREVHRMVRETEEVRQWNSPTT
jgi:hypothetical protein